MSTPSECGQIHLNSTLETASATVSSIFPNPCGRSALIASFANVSLERFMYIPRPSSSSVRRLLHFSLHSRLTSLYHIGAPPRPAIVGRHITSGSPPNFDVHWLLASIHLKYLFVAHPAYLLLCRALLLFAITVTHRSSSGTANCG